MRLHPRYGRGSCDDGLWPDGGTEEEHLSDTFDILIEGGTVVDGTGAPGRVGAVGIDGDRLRLLDAAGAAPAHAGQRIDATGKVVAPGFIDLHSHGGLMILADPRHEPKVRQGITTEVIGVDGNSYAPFARREDLEAFVELNGGLDGRPDIAFDWDSVASYLARFDGTVAVNIAYLIGNSALRVGAIGWETDAATDDHLDAMRGALREGMEEGAFGLSSGLDYPPGSYATTDELVALMEEAARLGGIYHTHVRYDLGDQFLDPFREAIEIGRRSGAATHLTHYYHRLRFPGTPDQMLDLVEEARATGQDVTFDAYPAEWASTRLLIMIPPWAQSGGPRKTKERLGDPAVRAVIRRELIDRGVLFAGAAGLAAVRLGYFARTENVRWEGRTIGEVVAETGADWIDVVCDLLVAEDLRVNQVTPGPHTDGIRRFLAHPVGEHGMVGTDATLIGAKPSPRTYGSFPRILGQFVRDEAILSLEEAVRRMTSAPAARLGLRDRGVLRDGAIADVVVFDPATIRSNATYDEPCQFPDGIEHVFVNGTPVVMGGEHTGALAGRSLRRGRD